MTPLLSLYDRAVQFVQRQDCWLLPSLARLAFAAVLLGYFWNSAATKLEGPFSPTLGGYAQIFPKAFEAAGYNVADMVWWQTMIVLFGAWAEFVLPALIVLGLITRLAALGMAGFVLVQSLTDLYGHGAEAGAWFDRVSDALILDQRALWTFLLVVLVVKGGGPLSADWLLRKATVRVPA